MNHPAGRGSREDPIDIEDDNSDSEFQQALALSSLPQQQQEDEAVLALSRLVGHGGSDTSEVPVASIPSDDIHVDESEELFTDRQRSWSTAFHIAFENFPKTSLMAERPKVVRRGLKSAMAENRISLHEYLVIWRFYAQEKGLDDFHFNADNEQFVGAFCSYFQIDRNEFNRIDQPTVEQLDGFTCGNDPQNHNSLVEAWKKTVDKSKYKKRARDEEEEEDVDDRKMPARETAPMVSPTQAEMDQFSESEEEENDAVDEEEDEEGEIDDESEGEDYKYDEDDEDTSIERNPNHKRQKTQEGFTPKRGHGGGPRGTRTRAPKPRHLFNPDRHGLDWSEEKPSGKTRPKKQVRRLLPDEQGIDRSEDKRKKKRRSRQRKNVFRLVIDKKNCGTSPGDFFPSSLWKYVDTKDLKRTYIVQVVSRKVNEKGNIKVKFKGYSTKARPVPANELVVLTDNDIETYKRKYNAACSTSSDQEE